MREGQGMWKKFQRALKFVSFAYHAKNVFEFVRDSIDDLL